MNMLKYSIFGKSVNEKGKARCGDYFCYCELKDEGIIVLSLADGVGSRHYDDIASQTGCDAFTGSFCNNRANDLSQRFEAAIRDADKQVSNPLDSSHRGMMCTFTGIAWDVTENLIRYCSIGDSRIYRYSSPGMIQTSKDSKKAVLMRDQSGKLLIQSGVLVIREGLTNALGYGGAEIAIHQEEFNPGEAFILCSDGMYNLPGFEQLLSESMLGMELEKSMEKFVIKNQEYYNDDASILVIRRSDQPENYREFYDKTISESTDYRQHHILAHLMTGYIQLEILSLIDLHDMEKIRQYTDCLLYTSDAADE